MRILAAALGALLISTSHPALALGGPQHDEVQQGEMQAVQQREGLPADRPQAEVQPPEASQGEPQQAEMQPAEASQGEPQQAEMQPAEAPQADVQQAEAQPAEAPQGEPQQAEMQPADAPQADVQQAEAQPAEAPQGEPQQADAQPNMPQQPEMQQAEVTQGVAPRAEMQQPEMPQTPMMQQGELPGELAQAAVPPVGLPRDVKWTVFVEQKYGTKLDLPSAVFAASDGPAYRGVGRQFKTPDGRALLAIYSQRNDAHDTPASYLKKNFKFPRAALAYERVTHEFFAVAGVMDGTVYYSRCNFSRNAGGAVHCFDLKYPVQERQSWDGIVTRMSRSLRPLHRG